MFVFQDFTVQAVMEMLCFAKSGLQLYNIWHFLNKHPPRTMHNSSRSQFNSSNYMPQEFGLRSHCMVSAFGSNARKRCWFGGQRECRKCRLVLAVSENVRMCECGLPLSPLMQGSVFLCLAVLFSSGDLEVSNSAIQIRCVCYILSSTLPISPLLLTFSSFPLSFTLLPSHHLFLSFLNLISASFLSSPV